MPKITWRHFVYILIGFAIIGLIALLLFGFYKAAAGVFAAIALLFGKGKGSPLQQYANAEVEAAKAHEQAEATYQGEVHAAEQQAASARQDLESASAKESQVTTQAIQTATTQEQLGKVVDKEVGKATTDIAAWESLTMPPKGQDGWARVVFVAWLVAIVIVGMLLVSSWAHATPMAPTDAHKAQVAKLIQALHLCRKGGNNLAITIRKERKQHTAAIKRCETKRKADNKKHITQKAILAKPPPVWLYVMGGVIAGGLIVGAIGVGVGYYLGNRTKATP